MMIGLTWYLHKSEHPQSWSQSKWQSWWWWNLVNLIPNHSHCLSVEPVLSWSKGKLIYKWTTWILMKKKIEPVNELLVEVDRAHHPPVDVAVAAYNRRRVRLSASSCWSCWSWLLIMIMIIIRSIADFVIGMVKMTKGINHNSLIHHMWCTAQHSTLTKL